MNWVSIWWKNDVGEEGRKHQSSPARRRRRPRPSLLWLVWRFSDVPWISNTTENDFIWFYFQKVVANQLSGKVAMTPFHKLPKDNISVSFLTNRFFAPFLFRSLNVLRMKAITKEVVWSTCIYLNSKTVWLPLIELQNYLAKLNNVPQKHQGRRTVQPMSFQIWPAEVFLLPRLSVGFAARYRCFATQVCLRK